MVLVTLNHQQGDIARWEKFHGKLTLTHRASLYEPTEFTQYHASTFRDYPPPEFAVAPSELMAPRPLDTPDVVA